MNEPIRIPPINDEEAALWHLAREVSGLLDGLPWVLIGGLMVRILEAEHGVTTTWTTGDLDTVLDVRALSAATQRAAARLQEAGFTPERHDQNLTYRFSRGSLLGAIIIKARVVANTSGRRSQLKHQRDLARLLALVPDPAAIHGEMTKKEHGYLRDRGELRNPGYRAWTNVANAENGVIALEVLAQAKLAT